jgi:retron-type reverse transcriptase
VKAFLKAGILTEDGTLADISAGSPQSSILSPLLSNVALSVLDEYIAQAACKARIDSGIPSPALGTALARPASTAAAAA